jgi:hypothetical protein
MSLCIHVNLVAAADVYVAVHMHACMRTLSFVPLCVRMIVYVRV